MWARGKPSDVEADFCLRAVRKLRHVHISGLDIVNQKLDIEGQARGEIPRIRDHCCHSEVLERSRVGRADHHATDGEIGLRHIQLCRGCELKVRESSCARSECIGANNTHGPGAFGCPCLSCHAICRTDRSTTIGHSKSDRNACDSIPKFVFHRSLDRFWERSIIFPDLLISPLLAECGCWTGCRRSREISFPALASLD